MAYKLLVDYGVYKITNKINGKVYIGSTNHIHRRRTQNFNRLKNGIHNSFKLQKDYDLYGLDAFEFDVIERHVNNEILLDREQFFIDKYMAYTEGYNVCQFSCSSKGRKQSEDQKKQHSERMKGKKLTKEHRDNLSIALKGRKLSEETKQKISESNKIAFSDPIVREKIRIANIGKTRTEEQKEQLSIMHKERWKDNEEEREKLSNRMKSFRHTDEGKAKIAESNRRRGVSQETRERMSIALKEYNRKKNELKLLSNG